MDTSAATDLQGSLEARFSNAVAPKIGLALSGGGSRAIAFHLGCLRALNRLGLLDRVAVLSTVSGGSVIGACFHAHQGDFPSFEAKIRDVLAQGLVKPMRRKFFSVLGVRIVAAFIAVGFVAACVSLMRLLVTCLSFLAPRSLSKHWEKIDIRSPLHRFASRTTLLEAALDEVLFKGARLSDLPQQPHLVVNATELRTGSAFRFGTLESGSWRCELKDARVMLTDGGVYDNLGLGCLWPDRSKDVSLNVIPIDTIICCSAGYGLRQDPPSQFFYARMLSVFATVFDRAQNASMHRLHEAKRFGQIKGFILPYLGQRDKELPNPPAGLVRREEAHAYPTNFNAMPAEWIERLSLRGEQLTLCLAQAYIPDLIREVSPEEEVRHAH
jgi:NTE family protein